MKVYLVFRESQGDLIAGFNNVIKISFGSYLVPCEPQELKHRMI